MMIEKMRQKPKEERKRKEIDSVPLVKKKTKKRKNIYFRPSNVQLMSHRHTWSTHLD
jgi:hypothetical protein